MVKVKIKIHSRPRISEFGVVEIPLHFPDLGFTRIYKVDYLAFKVWKEANPSKTWKDYLRETLGEAIKRTILAKKLVDKITEGEEFEIEV